MPMIDIIFQLLIFFLLSAKFIAFEGQLQAHLPKDRGPQSTSPPIEITNVTFDLEWDDAAQRVSCYTFNYQPPGGSGASGGNYRFGSDPKTEPAGGNTLFGAGARRGKVDYDYVAPDFFEIETYLAHRKAKNDAAGTGKGIPVSVNFSDAVPWQMVVNILDICTRLGISDFSINAKPEN